ncbi:hypothetical protein FHR83_006119 [Actinoplanes campanulatus]|uniref:Uncharacterized protein n=1 Tax=Actinoplanes campanulatus TaxID=113559 RepID=A0A7W5ALR1_9ACTN|nr:hypothetical protein [Actinoplanes campanulatus]MBB3098420.1 hypothetical protein [Actinoplanes campanulatus]
MTVGQVRDRAMELGIAVGPAEDDLRDQPLSYYGEDVAGALIDMLEGWGAGVRIHPKVDGLLEGYRDLFDRFAASSGGAVTITDVELLDGADGERIRMLVNGDELVWHLEHQSDRYIDTLMVFEIADRLTPRDDTDPRVFVEVHDADEQSGYVFADPAALSILIRELGIEQA